MATVALTVPNPPGPDPYPPQYGPWQDCSGVGPSPLAAIVGTAALGDTVRIETAASTDSAARVRTVATLDGDPATGLLPLAPPVVTTPLGQCRAVRLSGQSTGLTLDIAPTNAAGASGSGSPANAWVKTGNAFGAGTSYLGTTDPEDVLVGVAAGLGNVWLTADGTDLTLTAPTGVLQLGVNDQVGYQQDAAGDLFLGSGVAGARTSITAGAAQSPATNAGQLTLAAAGPIVITAEGGSLGIEASTHVEISAAGGISLAPNTTAPNASAGVDMSTWNTLGLGLPQVPAATLLAIPSPLAGLTAFDSTNSIVRVNVGSPGTPNYRKAAGGPLVRATNTSGQSIPATTSTTVTGWTSVTNQGAAFVPSTGIFTAPVAGFYSMDFGSQFVAGTTILNGAYRASLFQNASIVKTREVTAQVAAISAVFSPSLSSAGIQMAAGDTMAFQTYQGTAGSLALSANAPDNDLSICLAS